MRTTLMCFLLLLAALGMSQSGSSSNLTYYPDPNLTFDQSQFDGRFAVMALSEGDFDFYVTDLTRFADKFEKVYFLNQTYADNRIVNIDADLEKAQLWFKAHYQYDRKQIICVFDDIMKETKKVSQSWTDAEKENWMKKFDKFKTLKNNE